MTASTPFVLLREPESRPAAPPATIHPVGSTPGRSAFPAPGPSRRTHVLLIFLFSALLAIGGFLLDGNRGINLADEGFLWYGAGVTGEGQVPLRDFQSYDPGRYYWVAGWSLLLGKGLLATRTACVLFQVLGVGCGLLALYGAGLSGWRIALAGLLTAMWMPERFKLFEQCTSLIVLLPAVWLLRRPDKRRALVAGVFVGLAAFMGRNHGVYCAAGFLGIFGFLAFKHRHVRPLLGPAGAWAVGVVTGYAPMLLMLAFVPGFRAAFMESLHAMSRNGATNLSLPVPWPWTIAAGTPSAFPLWVPMAQGCCFVMLLAGFAGIALVVTRLPLARLRDNTALVAGCALGIPYAHYAFSRADLPHLCHSMPLLVVTLLALRPVAWSAVPAWWGRALPVAAVLAATGLTGFATVMYSPLSPLVNPDEKPLTEYELDGETFRLDGSMISFLDRLKVINKTFIRPGENLLIAPYSPTLYGVLHRRSPLWEIYFLWSPSEDKQREMTRELETKNVRWVLLQADQLDGRADRRLSATHPVFMDYLKRHYKLVNQVPLPGRHGLLRRVDEEPAIPAP